MFGLTVEKPKAVPVSTRAGQIKTDAYTTLAKRLSYTPADVSVITMRDLLLDHGIDVYPLEKVCAWMDHKTRHHRWGWLWRPLRGVDRLGFDFGEQHARHRGEKGYREYRDYSSSSTHVYPHAVPMHALEKVELISNAELDFKPSFLVSDFAPKDEWQIEPRPDPFLMVVIPNQLACQNGMGRFVIDFWDEPGFGL